MTGSTDTSLWTNYNKGIRSYCGHNFPDGMRKNQKLSCNIVTPTTKEIEHDRPITPAEIISENWLTQQQWEFASQKALELFNFGQKVAGDNGLILVDTKYEFGIDEDGEIILIDEIHTPDSSRYWLADGYENCFEKGIEPYMIDKEFFRLWFKENCDPYRDADIPEAPIDLVVELSARYIELFERITKQKFIHHNGDKSVSDRIVKNVIDFLEKKGRKK